MLPRSHVLLRRARVRAAVRRDLVESLGAWLLDPVPAEPAGAVPVRGGRGGGYRAELPGGVRAVVRPYRRGGLLARVLHRTYVGLFPRPLVELAVTEAARARGVPAAEVLAARVAGGRFVYQGMLVTAEVVGGVPLLDALDAAPRDLRSRVAEAAGAAVGALHAAGVVHADLNVTNILVYAGEGGAVATLVDFDRARLRRAPLAARARRQSLARLARSARKLDPGGALTGGEARVAFRAGYARVLGASCGC